MTQSEARTRVRQLLDQTDNTDTQFSDSMIDNLVNQGRRLFARILPNEMLPNLKKTGSLSLTSGYSAFPSDFLRRVPDAEVKVDSVFAKEIEQGERWRLRELANNTLTAPGAAQKYYYLDDAGVNALPTSATTLSLPYIKMPAVLDGTDNTDLTDDVEDFTIDFAFYRCMGTERGDVELATFILQERGISVKGAIENANL